MPTLAELREKLKAAREAAAAARAKATADGATDADRTAYKDALTAAEKALDMVKDAEREEALDAATTSVRHGGRRRHRRAERSAAADGRFAYARPAEKMSILDEATLMAAASAKSRAFLQAGIAKSPIEILGDEGYERFVKELKDRASANAARRREKTNTTLTSADGGILLPTPERQHHHRAAARREHLPRGQPAPGAADRRPVQPAARGDLVHRRVRRRGHEEAGRVADLQRHLHAGEEDRRHRHGDDGGAEVSLADLQAYNPRRPSPHAGPEHGPRLLLRRGLELHPRSASSTGRT